MSEQDCKQDKNPEDGKKSRSPIPEYYRISDICDVIYKDRDNLGKAFNIAQDFASLADSWHETHDKWEIAFENYKRASEENGKLSQEVMDLKRENQRLDEVICAIQESRRIVAAMDSTLEPEPESVPDVKPEPESEPGSITYNWLESIGFSGAKGGSHLRFIRDCNWGPTGLLVEPSSQGKFSWTLEQSRNGVHRSIQIPSPECRSDVVKLLALLGFLG